MVPLLAELAICPLLPPQGQAALGRYKDLWENLSMNRNLSPEVWFKLYTKPDAKRAMALVDRPLSIEQAKVALRGEKRKGVLEVMASRLPGDRDVQEEFCRRAGEQAYQLLGNKQVDLTLAKTLAGIERGSWAWGWMVRTPMSDNDARELFELMEGIYAPVPRALSWLEQHPTLVPAWLTHKDPTAGSVLAGLPTLTDDEALSVLDQPWITRRDDIVIALVLNPNTGERVVEKARAVTNRPNVDHACLVKEQRGQVTTGWEDASGDGLARIVDYVCGLHRGEPLGSHDTSALAGREAGARKLLDNPRLTDTQLGHVLSSCERWQWDTNRVHQLMLETGRRKVVDTNLFKRRPRPTAELISIAADEISYTDRIDAARWLCENTTAWEELIPLVEGWSGTLAELVEVAHAL